MRRIAGGWVVLDDKERIVHEVFDLLVDSGLSESDAVIFLRGSRVPGETRHLDRVLTPEFVDWLME